MRWVARALWDRPCGISGLGTRVGIILRVIGARPDNLRSRVEKDKRIMPLDCSARVETKLWRCGSFRLDGWIVLGSWSHFIFLLIDGQSRCSAKASVSDICSSDFIGLVDVELNECIYTSMSLRK